MVDFVKCNSFVEAIHQKKHNMLTDTFKLALCAAANTPVAADAVLADLTEIAYTNLSSRTLTVLSAAQAGGLFKWVLDDLLLTASGGAVETFRYIVIYNDTATNDELVGFYDLEIDVTLADTQTFLCDFDSANGVFDDQ